jgi:hypothetical protein
VTEETVKPDVNLIRIQRSELDILVEGVSPLIIHKWSEKAKRLMRHAQSGAEEKLAREPKVPEEEAEGSLYRLDDGRPGMPATAFKAAMVGAARLFSGLTMVTLKSGIFVTGDGPDQLVPIEGALSIREDMPRNANGNADLRYRYQVWPWMATLRVIWLPTLMSSESVVNLVDAAGNGGIGDWRPSAPKSMTGTYGRFQVAR